MIQIRVGKQKKKEKKKIYTENKIGRYVQYFLCVLWHGDNGNLIIVCYQKPIVIGMVRDGQNIQIIL